MVVILSNAKDLKTMDGEMSMKPYYGKALEILHSAALHSG